MESLSSQDTTPSTYQTNKLRKMAQSYTCRSEQELNISLASKLYNSSILSLSLFLSLSLSFSLNLSLSFIC